MYNGSIAFPVDKFPNPISHLISVSIVSSPFVPTNHSSPFSFYLLHNTKCSPCQPEGNPGAAPECVDHGSLAIAVFRRVRELAPKQNVQDNPENV